MSHTCHIVVCASVVPDPLQRLEPTKNGEEFGLKNEMMLPHILDPWAAHALFEAANLVKKNPGSKIWLVSIGPKAKLQQVMMTIAQKVPFELVALDGPSSGFTESGEVAEKLFHVIDNIEGLQKEKMLLFGGWQSASRGTGTTLQMLGEMLGIIDQFQGVDELSLYDDGDYKILERVEGGRHQESKVKKDRPLLLGWATGNLPEPPNNPQVGMLNMRTIMPSLQRSQKSEFKNKIAFDKVDLPFVKRETRIEKNLSTDEIAKEIVSWIKDN